MTIKNDLFLVKNLYGYENVISPPNNLPKDMITCYLTDKDEYGDLALSLGWQKSVVTHKFLDIEDPFSRRSLIGYINSKPQDFIKDLMEYDRVFISDSNIQTIWDGYENFINSCQDDKALYVTSGYYPEEIDHLPQEIYRSNQPRWEYNYDSIYKCANDYINELTDIGVDINTLRVCSAKYFGWNPKNKNFNTLSELMYAEHKKHIQGNIILTYLLGKYPDYVYNYNNGGYAGGVINQHNFNA